MHLLVLLSHQIVLILYSVLVCFYNVYHWNARAFCLPSFSHSLDPAKVSMVLICLLKLLPLVTHALNESLLYTGNVSFNNSVARVSKSRNSILSSFNALHLI